MKILSIFFLCALAGCYADEDCVEEKAQKCVDQLLISIVDDSSEEEVCSELQNSIGCLENTVESCPGAEEDGEMKEGIDALKQLRSDNCEANDISTELTEEIKACFEENEDYIYECMFERTAAALEALGNEDDVENIDENALQCRLYEQLTECFIGRIGEKCGKQAARIAEEALSDVPDDIKEACAAVQSVDTPEFKLLEDRRKKK